MAFTAYSSTNTQIGGFTPYTPTTPVEQPKESFLQKIGGIIQKRSQALDVSLERQDVGKQTFAETNLQLIGGSIGGLYDIVSEGVNAVMPEPIKTIFGKGVSAIANIPIVKTFAQEYGKFKQNNPRAANNIEAALNIASIIPSVKAISITKGVISRPTTEVIQKSLTKQSLEEALYVVRKPLTKLEKASAVSTGQAKVSIFGSIQSIPSIKDISAAESVAGIVRVKSNPLKNSVAINNEIARMGKTVDAGLDAFEKQFPYFGKGKISSKSVRSTLGKSKEDSRIIFGADKTLENTYDTVVDEFVKIYSKKEPNLSGLRQARIEFDGLMNKKFPSLYKNPYSDNIRYNAIKDVRNSANQMVADALPVGNTYRDDLLKMTNMYTATKNIGLKVADVVDISIIERVLHGLRKNVVVYGVTGGILTAAALSHLLTNPVIIGTLLLGGTYKLGSKIINSQTLKKTLIVALKESKNLDEATSFALSSLIQQIDKSSLNLNTSQSEE